MPFVDSNIDNGRVEFVCDLMLVICDFAYLSSAPSTAPSSTPITAAVGIVRPRRPVGVNQ
jgi:hypothetical protein